MTINFDESAIITIYRKKTRKQTIENIRDMMSHLEDDETELKEISESALKKLVSMKDEDFDALEIDILE